MKSVIKVSGMHCKSCEMILEEKIKDIPGITKVSASTSRQEVKIVGNDFDTKAVGNAITAAGYKLGAEEETILTREKQVYLDVILFFLIVAIFYLISSIIGISNIIPSIGADSYTFGVVVLLGITAGFSTCMALVGGLVLGFTARYREKHPEITGFKAFIPNIYFNIGRIVGFFFLGGLLGEIGTVLRVSSVVNGWLLLLVSAVMLLVGLQLTGLSPAISRINFTMPKFIANLFSSNKKSNSGYTHIGVLTAGALTFFLPCGFTQAMQLVAVASGGFLSGALIMSLFAIGTSPGLLLVGSVASFAKGNMATKLFRFMGVVVVVLAIVNLLASLNLIGIHLPKINFPSNTESSQTNNNVAVVDGNEQVVNMDVDSSGYSPNSFTVKKGVPVRWVINLKDISTCASSLVFSDMGIQQILKKGENVITFTPSQTGTLRFTCSMGMYSGEFKVID
ncbi:MAG: sulfite exporter TauE/SafE family protein [bacterium]